MDILYSGTSVNVKAIKKKTGEISYGLFRAWAPSPFMQYETAREAIYIAKYIERFGGSFASDIRKAAKRSWMKVGQFEDE